MASSSDIEVTPLHYVETALYADSVETCPVTTGDGCQLVACGMYQLEDKATSDSTGEQQQQRVGQINLYEVDLSEQEGTPTLKEVDVVSGCPGVLDMKWTGADILGVALASGELSLFKLYLDKKTVDTRLSSALVSPGSILLSLAWQQTGSSSSGSHSVSECVCCSDSGGGLTLCQLSPAGLLPTSHWAAHQHECWTCLYHTSTPTLIYSGGDDCKLRAWDTRQLPGRDNTGSTPAAWTSSLHNAGVCSILVHPYNDHQLLSGSYDDVINLFDDRYLKRTVSTLHVGGGVWRMKLAPAQLNSSDTTRHIAAACMHNGFHIVSLLNEELQDLVTFTGHESLAYGIDWLAPPVKGNMTCSSNNNTSYLSSCSFYDRKLSLWKWKNRH